MSGLAFYGYNSSDNEEDVFFLENGQLEVIAGKNFVNANNNGAGVGGSPIVDGNGADSTKFGGAPVIGFTNSAGDHLVLFNGDDSNNSENLFIFDQQTNTTWNLEFTSTPGHDNSVGFGGLNPQDFVLYNGDVYFVGTSGTAGGGTKTTLWTTNGDMSALIPDTFAVGGIDGGGSNIPTDNGQMAVLTSNNTLYFNGSGDGTSDALWSYNPTNGFSAVSRTNGLNPQDMISANIGGGDELFFTSGNTLLAYNGVGGPKAIDSGINAQDLTAVTFGSTTDVFFNGDTSANDPQGLKAGLYEISKSTIQLVPGSANLDPQDITALDGKIYFAGTDGVSNGQINEGLWVYNPATPNVAPTEITANIEGQPGKTIKLDSANYQLDMDSSDIGTPNPQAQISTDGTLLYFTATHGSTNQGLFSYNPTTNTVNTHVSGTSGSDAFNLTHV
jgi:hypothetical protein